MKTLMIFKDNLIEISRCEDTERLSKLPIMQCDEKKCVTKWTFANLALIIKFFSDSSGKLFSDYK
jgi:hypothetical protein